jgi:hypothetical protein
VPFYSILLLLIFSSPLVGQGASQKVWQVGTFDESSQEFKGTGIDYSNSSQDPVFYVGKSDPTRDWYAFQPGTGNGRAGFRPHPFTVKFDLPSAPQGVFSLKVGLLAYMARTPRLQIEINGHRGLFYLHPKLNYTGGDKNSVFIPIYSYGTIDAEFSSQFLVKGTNSLVLTAIDEPAQRDDSQSNGLGNSGLIYDALELDNAAAGHPIVIWEEEDSVIPGVTDFTQHDHLLRPIQPDTWNESLVRDVPGFYDRKFGRAGDYRVEIQYADDGSRVEGSVSGKGPLRVRLDGLTADKICRRLNDLHSDGIPDVQLTVENVASKPIEDIIVSDDMGAIWQYRWGTNPNSPEYKKRQLALEGEPPTLRINLATLAPGWPSLQFSCHDEGWEGWPADKSPYVAQGSRALFGYSCLFTPMIPIFFAGEEFDATFRPIPWLFPHLLGGQDPGKGRWLYGNMLDWDDLKKPQHAAMLDDVKKMIAVRKREAGILAVPLGDKEPKLRAVPHDADIPVPVPYIRWNDRGAILVVANRDTSRDASLKLRIPLKEIGLPGHAGYKVTELWPGGEIKTYTESDLAAFTCTIRRDKT